MLTDADFRRVDGQMWRRERELLYHSVLEARPKVAVEVGTWNGAGSTFFISQALAECGGVLYSFEVDEELHRLAVEAHLGNPCVRLFLGKGEWLIPSALNGHAVDFAFLDGSDNPQEAMDQIALLEPRMPAGAILMMHDWFEPKARLARPYLLDSPKWELLCELPAGGGFEDGSVGLGKLRRK